MKHSTSALARRHGGCCNESGRFPVFAGIAKQISRELYFLLPGESVIVVSPDSPEKISETLAYLDAQREKVLPILEHLKTNVDRMEQSRKVMVEFMASDEYRRQTDFM